MVFRKLWAFLAALAFMLAMAGCAKKEEGVQPPRAGSTIKGKVVIEGMKDLSGTEVSVPLLGLTTHTTADGSFALTGLEEGAWDVVVTREGYVKLVKSVTVPSTGTVDIGILTLIPSAKVRGTVRLEGQQAHGGAKISLKSGEISLEATSADDGSYEIEDVPPGSYALTISAKGFDPAEISIDVEAGKVKDVGEISLKPMAKPANLLFEDDFQKGLDKWEVVSAGGTVQIIETDKPPAYGPKVLEVNSPGSVNIMLFIKDLKVKDVVIEVLWRDAALPEDADGILVARVSNPVAANDPSFNGYLLELDTDTGLHIDSIRGGQATTFSPAGGKSPGTWVWLKWYLKGSELKAKWWQFGQPEPEGWEIEATNSDWQEGFVGIRCWSGVAHIAYIRVTKI